MVRNRVLTIISLATLGAAGCTKSEFPFSGKDGKDWKGGHDARMAAATEATPPKILPATYFAAGQLLERQGRTEAAIYQYRRALVVAHDYTAAHHRLGLLLSDAGRHGEALASLQKAASLAPSSAVVRNNLGYELMLQERWQEAEQELARAAELEPNFAHARINLGMVQSKLGRFEEALANFRGVLPEADALYNMGLMYRGQRRFDDAAEAFNRVLEIEPNFPAAAAQLEQIAPRLEQLAWNVPEQTDSPSSTETGPDSDSSGEGPWTTAVSPSASDWSSSQQSTDSDSANSWKSWTSPSASEAQDNPWVTLDIETQTDGSFHRGSSQEWLSPLLEPADARDALPPLDLSHASSPPTLGELTEAMSIVRNEIECHEEQTAEYGWTPAPMISDSRGFVDATTSSPAEQPASSSSISAWEVWLNESEGDGAQKSGMSESERRRKTMSMTIIPRGTSEREFVGPPSPNDLDRLRDE